MTSIFGATNLFPSFYQAAANGLSEIDVMVQLVKHFSWKWVGILVSDDDMGQKAGDTFKKAILSSGGCVAFFILFDELPYANPGYIKKMVKTINESSANVTVAFFSPSFADMFVHVFASQKLRPKIWITSSYFSRVAELQRFDIRTSFNGTLSLATHQGDILGFKDYFYSTNPMKYPDDDLLKDIWPILALCTYSRAVSKSLPMCIGNETMDDKYLELYNIFIFRTSYAIYTAIYAMVHSLRDMYATSKSKDLLTDFQHWRLNSFLQRVVFSTSSGDTIYFKPNKEAPTRLDILKNIFTSLVKIVRVKVGNYNETSSSGHPFKSLESSDVWAPYFQQPVVLGRPTSTQRCHRDADELRTMVRQGAPGLPGGCRRDLLTSLASHLQLPEDSGPEKAGERGEAPPSLCNDACKPGYRKAKREGEPPCCYDCVRCAKGEMSNTTDSQTCLKCSRYENSNILRTGCVPKDLDFLSYGDTLGATLTTVSLLFSIITSVILGIFWKYRETPIVKANNRNLSYILLISITLCFTSTLLFIGRPSPIRCLLRQVAFGVVFTVSVSSVLAKTLTVIIAFKATQPGGWIKKFLGTRLSILFVFLCSMGKILLSVIWIMISPSYLDVDTQMDTILLLCHDESFTFFFLELGYIGVLAMICLGAAYVAKDFPDCFNEAKNITFSILIFISVWVAFVPTYLSVKGKNMVAVEVFTILTSSAGLLCFIFLPKCYIIFISQKQYHNR
ncbi:vomeronasal type-2 receptor 26-like [Leptodactylus fuscus]|uniref:vomeronasal type-2 receptor 26-like n=1 Tax=Leptodactylus fuscus TaxID=238119 RepID=UPI003F4EF6F0